MDAASYTKAIVRAALTRSLGGAPRLAALGDALVLFCDDERERASLAPEPRGKSIVLGPPPAALLPCLGLRRAGELPPLSGMDEAPPAAGDIPHTESPAFLAYGEHPLLAGVSGSLRRRPFTRFDYTDEWNNLGFGRIRTDASPWAARGGFVPDGAVELAGIRIRERPSEEERTLYAGSYLALLDTPKASVLWCARPVGPVDSPEWSVIERFISDWRPEELPCLPCLLRTPAGCRCLVSMRLDCDEDVASARDIFEWYAGEGIPLSLAVKTSLPLRREDIALMEDVAAHGGTILSHSHEHRLNWGDSYKEAREDAARSGRRLAEVCPRLPVPDLAVSPFHSNPPYAVRALAAAGFQGFVSGIIHNDPEYLLGRAGVVPFARGIVGVSQQSMLHGDCYRRQQESVEAHVQAFESQYAAGGIFGYLDHPFSARYQYDWQDAGQRLGAHHKLVAALRGYAGVWFCSQRQCFDFVRTLSAIRLTVGRDGKIRVQAPQRRQPLPVYRYRGMETACRPDAG